MSVSFRILSDVGVVYVRYSGHAQIAETARVFKDYTEHKDFRPGQKQLVDLTDLISWDTDYVALMKSQAQKAEAFVGARAQTLIVYLAPNEAGQKLAQLAMNSWDPFPTVVTVVQDNASEALAILGLQSRSVNDLLKSSA